MLHFLFSLCFCSITILHSMSVFIMFTVVKLITEFENGKHAFGKRKVGPGNIGHLSKTFPLEPNIFKVSVSYNIVKLRRMNMK